MGSFSKALGCSLKPTANSVILLFAVISLILSFVQVSRCTFMDASSKEDGDRNAELGLFSFAVYDRDGDMLGCTKHIDSEVDSMLKFARILGVLTVILAASSLMLVSLVMCLKPERTPVLWGLARIIAVCETLTQIFTFMILGTMQCSEEGCKLSSAGIAAVFNVILFSVSSILTNLVAPPADPWFVWGCELETIVNPSIEAINMLEMEGVNLQENGEMSTPSIGEDSNDTRLIIPRSLQRPARSPQQEKWFRMGIFASIVTAWAISLVGVRHCTFMLIGPIGGNKSDYSGIGLYTRASYDGDDITGCLSYPDNARDAFDFYFELARACGAIAASFMSAAVLLHLVHLFGRRATEVTWYITRVLLPSAVIAELLVFLVFRSELCNSNPDFVECIPGGSGIVVMINLFLLTALSVVMCIVPPPAIPIFAPYLDQKANAPEAASTTSSLVVGGGDVTEVPRKPVSLYPLREEAESEDDTESDSQEYFEPRQRIVKIDPVPRHFEDTTETMTITIDITDTEKKTIKTIVHPDGSKTITTTIEELVYEDELEEEIDEDFAEPRRQAQAAHQAQRRKNSPRPPTDVALDPVPQSSNEESCAPPPPLDNAPPPDVPGDFEEKEDAVKSPTVQDIVKRLEAVTSKEMDRP